MGPLSVWGRPGRRALAGFVLGLLGGGRAALRRGQLRRGQAARGQAG